MIDRVPSIAPFSPPLTGASSARTPFAAAASAIFRDVSGRTVLMSMYSRPGSACSRTPPGPSTTCSTCGESGSMVMTVPAPASVPAMSPPALPPAATSRLTAASEMSWPITL